MAASFLKTRVRNFLLKVSFEPLCCPWWRRVQPTPIWGGEIERPISKPSGLTNSGACRDICFSGQNSDCHLLFATVTASWLETTSAAWHRNYTLWQRLIGKWEMGLKGFVGIRTGSCCMTNEHCERWAAEQMQLTHVPVVRADTHTVKMQSHIRVYALKNVIEYTAAFFFLAFDLNRGRSSLQTPGKLQ